MVPALDCLRKAGKAVELVVEDAEGAAIAVWEWEDSAIVRAHAAMRFLGGDRRWRKIVEVNR